MKIILGFDLEGFNSDEAMIKVGEPLYVRGVCLREHFTRRESSRWLQGIIRELHNSSVIFVIRKFDSGILF